MADTEVIADTTEKMSTDDVNAAEEDTTTTAASEPKEDVTAMETDEPSSKTVKEELLKEEMEELKPDSVVKETVDENGDVFEETTEVTRKVVKRTMKITETSSTTKTTTMTTPAKLYGKDLSEYDEIDVDALLAQLSPEEINILAKEVDPDDNFLPPNQRCSYECTKDPTGPLDRKKLIEHINKEALETPDLPELEPYVKGTVRGKKWVPPPRDEREIQADEQIAIDLGEEYEHALSDATQEEIIDLAAILGFHSMMNQDQYHASIHNKGQPVGMGWDGITKSTTQKLYPMDPPNNTDVEESIKRVKDDDPKLIELNLNNIKNISDEKFEQLFDALPQNEHLEVLSLTNVGLTDKTALLLAEAIEKSKTLRVLNVETNFINPPVIVTLVKSLLKARTIEEFRASNQRSTVLGNKIEMEITDLVEKNTSLLRLGLHLEFNDARHRVAAHLQRNIDRNEHELRKGTSSSPIPNATSSVKASAGRVDDLSSSLKTIKAKSPKPMHIVLTPQDRIDSKSELIASLVSQKQENRHGRGEFSLPVPQITRDTTSPQKDKENISPMKVKEKEKKFPVQDRQPPAKVAKTEFKPKAEAKQDIKQVSPVRHPKLGELRHSNLSKAVDEELAPVQENGRSETLERKSPEQIAQAGEKPDVKVEKVDVPAATLDATAETQIDIAVPLPEASATIEKPSLDTAHPLPKAVETVKEPLSEPIKSNEQPSVLPQPAEVSSEAIKQPRIEVESSEVTASGIVLQAEPIPPAIGTSEDLSEKRDRLSESVSPSRNLEDRMTLLRAKIDSFAEVADEKLSSLRSKFDDIARDTSIEESNVLSKQLPEKVKTEIKAEDLVKPVEIIPETPVLTTLPPVAPTRNVNSPKPLASKPLNLNRTPNSVGISFLYQKQQSPRTDITVVPLVPLIIKPELSTTVIEDRRERSLPDAQPEKPTVSQDTRAQDISQPKEALPDESSLAIDVQDTKSVENAAQPLKSLLTPGIQPKQAADTPNPKPGSPVRDEIKANPADNPTIAPVSATERSTSENPSFGNPISNPRPKASTLPLLSIKKGESLQIDPIQMVEAGTQSLAPPSPLSRLSVKKGDPQKIDPVKMTEIGTQSLPKTNPLSRLSIKKRDPVAINPVTRSEVSTQSSIEKPKAEASSQTIEKEPIETVEEATQTPLVFSSLEHDYIFPGLRRVPHLPRPKTINIGGGDRVIVKPSSKPINEVLMLLYPVLHGHNTAKPQEEPSLTKRSSKSFGLEEDLIKDNEPPNTIKDLEETLQKATEVSEVILNAPPKPSEEDLSSEEPKPAEPEVITSVKTEIVIPLVEEPKPDDRSTDDRADMSKASRYERQYTAVEEVTAMSRTTIAKEAHVKVIDKAYKSMAAVSSGEEHISKTSIRSANMWESLSSNLIKASEQTLIDISKAAEMGEGMSSTRKIGKVSVYSSIEDLSRSSRSDHIGSYIKTVEKTSVYSSTEDIPLGAYTRYSDRYKDDQSRSVYSYTEDLPRSKYNDQYTGDLKSQGKVSVYSSTEDLPEVSYTTYSERYSDANVVGKVSDYSVDPYRPPQMEELPLLPRSKFSDRYKPDTKQKFPVSKERPYYKSSALDDLPIRSKYRSTEDISLRSKISDRHTHEAVKPHDSALQTAVLSSISRNQSALRPYTYVPSTLYTDLAIDHVRQRATSPTPIHTSTLQLTISPSGISELPQTRSSKYKSTIDKPSIVISRAKDERRSLRGLSPIERARPSSNLLTPYRKVSDQQANDDDSIDESSQPALNISSASAATAAEYNTSTTSTTTSTTPKKRANIMDTIKMLKSRVRDVITTEDRFSETHRLPSSSSIMSPSQSSSTSIAKSSGKN